MALFAAFITGQNAIASYARCGTTRFTCSPNDFDEAVIQIEGDADEFKPALFATRDEARAIALACRWNNQRFEVRTARGRVRQRGKLISINPDEVHGCGQ